MSLDASVVVPTYRRPDLLERCLAALSGQTIDGDQYEVIVADDAASEATQEQVERLAERVGVCVRYVPVRGTQGPAAARNVGWRGSRSQVIAFTDDDCLPEPGWLAAGISAIKAGADAAVGRIVVPIDTVPPTDYECDAAGLAEAEFATANIFCRRSVLEQVGGFDERFTAAWREDSDLHFGLLRGGYRIVNVPEAVVVHPVRPAPWGISIRQQKKSQFNALLFRKHPDLYRQRIQGTPPLHYYLASISLGAASIATAFHRPRFALSSLAIWGAITAGFCRRRLRVTSRDPSHLAEMVVTSTVIPPLAVYWRLRGAFRFRIVFF